MDQYISFAYGNNKAKGLVYEYRIGLWSNNYELKKSVVKNVISPQYCLKLKLKNKIE